MHASSSEHAIVCIPTLSFLSTELALEIWRTWDKLRREDPHLDELQSCGTSMEPGVVQPLYTHAGWIPRWADPSRAYYVGVDLAPGERGTPGQIINFGRDEEAHFSPARDLEGLLDILVTEVQSGRWRASEIESTQGPLPWFGDPKEHFFNALYRHFRRHMPREANDALADAKAATEAGEHERALELLDEAIALDGKRSDLHAKRAEALETLERYGDADQSWKRACALGAKQGDPLYYSRAQNLVYCLQDYGTAETVLRKGVALYPRSTRIHGLLIQVLGYYLGRFEDSLPLCEAGCALPTAGADIVGDYAYALGALGRADDAKEQARLALERDEDGDALAVEFHFYLYALTVGEDREPRLRELRALLDQDTRTEDWNFGPIIATAARLGHPEIDWLEALARVANGQPDATTLAGWLAWNHAGPRSASE